MLFGRDDQSRVLRDLLTAVRGGAGRMIVVCGEPGIGKTALVESVVAAAVGVRVLRTVGIEAERELPYAGLQSLLRDGIGDLADLPRPQRIAVETAVGRTDGRPPDRLLVGLALLNLLSAASSRGPLVCVVDDAQWLDVASAQALAFAARRVSKEAVGFVFIARGLTDDLRGLPTLTLAGLAESDARELLAHTIPDRLDKQVVDRVIAEAHGNPLALIELHRGLTAAQVAGGFGAPTSGPISSRIEDSFRRRSALLPPDSVTLLLVAAADPTGDAGLVWRAADRLGVTEHSAEPVERAGLVDFGEKVVFGHPLMRSAAYTGATAKQRRDVHRALADATDAGVDPDRRAWHLAQATMRPTESIAAALEASAGRAESRGGYAAAGALLTRSVALTPNPAHRAARALRAAHVQSLAGALDAAITLVDIAEQGPLAGGDLADLDALRGQIAFGRHRGNEVAPHLLSAAHRLESVDPDRARDTYLHALVAALFAGHLGADADAHRVARAARRAPRPKHRPRPAELLLEGLAMLVTDGYAPGTAMLKTALTAFGDDDLPSTERLRWWIAAGTAGLIWDHDAWDDLTARHERLAREVGAVSLLPITLGTRVGMCAFAGDLTGAGLLVDQIQVVTSASDNRRFANAAVLVAALRGDQDGARALIDDVTRDALSRGEGLAVTMARWATAIMCNASGQYDEAFRAARTAIENPNDIWYRGWAAVELIEAASRTNRADAAAPALEQLIASTTASASPWALGVQARCLALLAADADAETLFEEALKHLASTRLRFDLARTRLLYGEWLRRRRRPRDARAQLRQAYNLFVEFGMAGFAKRAETELSATGEKSRKRTVEAQTDLTPQETRIAEFAAAGSTNNDIAEQLFISPATVEYHLAKAYRKLGIRTRAQLATALRTRLRRGTTE